MQNWSISEEDNQLKVIVKTKLFPLEVIYASAYMFIDRAYLLFEGDPQEEITVEFTMKEKSDASTLKKTALEFNNQLLNYAVYVIQATRNKSLREAIIGRALLTNTMKYDEWLESTGLTAGNEKEDLYVKDPLGIAEPWSPEKAQGIDLSKDYGDPAPQKVQKKENQKEKGNG